MRITVDRTELARAITWASKGLPRRPVVPVLGGIRLQVAGARLTISAFDYDVSATASVAGVGVGEYGSHASAAGSMLVNGAALAGIVKAAPKGKTVRVALERVDTPASEATEATGDTPATPARGAMSALVVTCQGSTSRLTAMPGEDYPDLPEMPPAAGVFTSGTFKRSAARVAALAGTDDTLPILTTVRLELGAGAVTMAATDRYRLGVDTPAYTATHDAPEGITPAIQIPAKLLADFAKTTGKDAKVTVHYSPAAGTVPMFGGLSDETRTVTFRADSGDFPRYRALMPGQADVTALVDAGALAAAVKRAAVVCERNTPVRLTFAPDSPRVVIQAGTEGESAAEESVDVAFDGAGAMTVAYNPGYLVSVLAGVTGDAWLSWTTPARPLVVSSAGETDPYRALIIPIRLAG
jgi:DNA polymerase-3 subunit beta